jgi:hypothetical protein
MIGALYFFFFLSGLSGLIYQVVWVRELGLVFGHSTYAITAVLVAFMAGLALGSAVFARRAARLSNPLRVYAGLEIGMGLYCACVPFLLAAGAGTYFELPFIGNDLLRPLATDLTPGQMLQLGWVYWRAGPGRALHCRLGGQPEGGYILSDAELNLATIAMFKGDSAPQPPPPGSGTFGAGCVIGNGKLGSR